MGVSQLKQVMGQITLENYIAENKLPEAYTHKSVEYYNGGHSFPSTRFQGSKNKITDWIWDCIKELPFNTALDAFGGTGSVAYMLKNKGGKEVTYNDILKFNHIIGKALIENSYVKLSEDDLEFILTKHKDRTYPTFIEDSFHDVFYLDEENVWLDMVITNINSIENEYKKAIAWFALFQACIIKRPYNLFHRANLYVRTSNVQRSFGNKTTWDTPFEQHFKKFVLEANNAIFCNKKECYSTNYDSLEMPKKKFDLVYIDTPYISDNGVGTDYTDFYHFLEGMVDYDNWGQKILRDYKHLPIKGKGENIWTKKKIIYDAFDKLFEKFNDSILVVSYRIDGIPSQEEILALLRKYKSKVYEINSKEYKYALSNSRTAEVLFIAE